LVPLQFGHRSQAWPRRIQDVCSRLNYSPLAIKWFAQAVRAGGAPATLLSDSKLVLKFCVANVIESLSMAARQVLNALIVTSRPHTFFILGEEIIALSNALRELRAANLILVSPFQQIGGDDYYLVKPITIEYIRNYFAPSIAEQTVIRQKQNQLSFARDRLFAARQAANVYNPNYVFIREDNADSDYVVADYLSSALACFRRRRGDQADEFIVRAKDMSPNYFEVYRVEAFIAAVQGNAVKAESAYDRAISLRPNHAPLRSLYGGFLMRIGDVERALEQFEEAVRLDDNQASLKLSLARAYTRLILGASTRRGSS
jgi:LuxR family glucitol operon transcriptional activator